MKHDITNRKKQKIYYPCHLVTLQNSEHNQKTISIKFVAIYTIKDQKGFFLYKMMMAEADTSFPK